MIQEKITAAKRESVRPYVLAWLVACVILVAADAAAIRGYLFWDPDDTLRLLQVRDWMAGQSWFDVRQHRMNPPDGAPMHWSRLVDMPLAATMLLLRPFTGAALAEVSALVIVPLLTLGIVMALVAALTRRLLDRDHAVLAAFIVPATMVAVMQLRPMRIDHHGWQIALALGAALAVLDTNRRRSGFVSGGLAATWLCISLEGLPFAVALVTLAALRWLADPREAQRLTATMTALAGISLLLFVLTRSSSDWGALYCDAVTYPHLAVLAFGSVGLALVTRLSSGGIIWGMVALGGLGAAALTLMMTLAPPCAAGPFETLDPLVYNLWYLNIQEGLPIWWQPFATAMLIIALPVVGLVGTGLQVRKASCRNQADWAAIFFLLAAATVTTIFVQRAGAVANLLALPGGVALFRAAQLRIAAMPNKSVRLIATLASFAIVAPGHAVGFASSVAKGNTERKEASASKTCLDRGEILALNQLPMTDIAAPLDLGPMILVHTHHRIIASGHHRNAPAMRDVISFFMSDPAEGRSIVQRRQVQYVVVCPGMPETQIYEHHGPKGLWAQLAQGRIPNWLEPVRLPGVKKLRIWRVKN